MLEQRICWGLHLHIELCFIDKVITYALMPPPLVAGMWMRRAVCWYRWCVRASSASCFTRSCSYRCRYAPQVHCTWRSEGGKGREDGVQGRGRGQAEAGGATCDV